MTQGAKTGSKTIFVRWVRSGIGFPRRQKTMVRSLGLRWLNQTVELEDTPSIRGLVARIPHLVEIVRPEAPGARISVPEYSIRPPDVAPAAHLAEPSQPAREPAAESQASPDTAGASPDIAEGKE